MMFTSMSRIKSRGCYLVSVLLLAPPAVVAGMPTYGPYPAKEAIEILHELAKGDLTVSRLASVIQPIVRERFGNGREIGAVIGEAVRSGILTEAEVDQSLRQSGCDPTLASGEGLCREVRADFREALTDVGRPSASTRAEEAVQAIARQLRERMIRENSQGYKMLTERLAEAMLVQDDRPIERGTALLDVTRPEDLGDVAVVEAIRSLGRAGTSDYERNSIAMKRFRAGVIVAMQGLIMRSRGAESMVDEIRGLPEEKVDRWLRETSNLSGADDAGRSACVIRRWRSSNEPPNRWQAWADLLECESPSKPLVRPRH